MNDLNEYTPVPPAPPQLVVTPRSLSVRPGDLIQLQCHCATPGVTVEWTKVLGALSPSAVDRNGLLTIRHVTAADAGRYRCSAISGSGRSESFAVISVTGQ